MIVATIFILYGFSCTILLILVWMKLGTKSPKLSSAFGAKAAKSFELKSSVSTYYADNLVMKQMFIIVSLLNGFFNEYFGIQSSGNANAETQYEDFEYPSEPLNVTNNTNANTKNVIITKKNGKLEITKNTL